MTRARQYQNKSKQSNQLRIIAGQWRGRKLNFPDLPGLRPTSDRIRETLFNWLQADIQGARCLDLFAGSGALGFEALSRGATEVVFVDTAPIVVNQIKQNFHTLNDQRGKDIQQSAFDFLNEKNTGPFDIVFLDPPFNLGLLEKSVEAIQKSECLKAGSLIYIESEKQLDFDLPASWRCLKEKKAGQVKYMLYVRD